MINIIQQTYLDQTGKLSRSYGIIVDRKRRIVFYTEEEVQHFIDGYNSSLKNVNKYL